MIIELRNPSELLPHEHFSAVRAFVVMLKIVARGAFTTPILIDRHSGTILDGHHRAAASRWLGLAYAPCASVEYLTDDAISVLPRRNNIPVEKQTIIAAALRGTVYPRKTTRHTYQLSDFVPVALNTLRRSQQVRK